MTRVAVLADIHSNPAALAAVLADAEEVGAWRVWVAGDVFGYGLAACETWRLLASRHLGAMVLGNHDTWVAGMRGAPPGRIRDSAAANAAELARQCPDALEWLARTPVTCTFPAGDWKVTMVHGTPGDPLDGRYYPDDPEVYPWLPGPGEILILGQTHHPLCRGTAETGLLLNPGSAGQPRDGDPRPSWALLDLASGAAVLRRSAVPAGAAA